MALVLAGGAPPSSLYAQRLRREAGRNVHFVDYVSGTAFEELRANAMLLVLPSDMEGLSLALLEPMGAGVCVLASDIPENREVVEDAGFLFRSGDTRDLESMLRFLIADPAARQSVARRGKQRIRDKYQWDEITRQIEQVCLEVMGRKAQAIDTALSLNKGFWNLRKPGRVRDRRVRLSTKNRVVTGVRPYSGGISHPALSITIDLSQIPTRTGDEWPHNSA